MQPTLQKMIQVNELNSKPSRPALHQTKGTQDV
jgi:hypothetical protein